MVPRWTFADIGSVSVDAFTVVAAVFKEGAFVDVFGVIGAGCCGATATVWTDFVKFGGAFAWTGGALIFVDPGASIAALATAGCFGDFSVKRISGLTSGRVKMALTNSCVVAVAAVVGGGKSVGTRAFVGAVFVAAESVFADSIGSVGVFAFVYVDTGTVFKFVAGFTFASVAAVCVDANAVAAWCAIVEIVVAFVDVDAVAVVFGYFESFVAVALKCATVIFTVSVATDGVACNFAFIDVVALSIGIQFKSCVAETSVGSFDVNTARHGVF